MDPTFDSLQRSYADALTKLSAAEAQAHPEEDPGQWCAQELVEHLILTYHSTASVLEERLEKGRPTQALVTPEHEARWRATIMAGRFPEGGKAPEHVRPGQLNLPVLSGEELASRLSTAMERMDRLLEQCTEKFGSQPMASHFAFGPLSVDQWRQFHSVHGNHHLGQMKRILASVHNDPSWRPEKAM